MHRTPPPPELEPVVEWRTIGDIDALTDEPAERLMKAGFTVLEYLEHWPIDWWVP